MDKKGEFQRLLLQKAVQLAAGVIFANFVTSHCLARSPE